MEEGRRNGGRKEDCRRDGELDGGRRNGRKKKKRGQSCFNLMNIKDAGTRKAQINDIGLLDGAQKAK